MILHVQKMNERKRATANIRIQLHCHNELMNMREKIIITTKFNGNLS